MSKKNNRILKRGVEQLYQRLLQGLNGGVSVLRKDLTVEQDGRCLNRVHCSARVPAQPAVNSRYREFDGVSCEPLAQMRRVIGVEAAWSEYLALQTGETLFKLLGKTPAERGCLIVIDRTRAADDADKHQGAFHQTALAR